MGTLASSSTGLRSCFHDDFFFEGHSVPECLGLMSTFSLNTDEVISCGSCIQNPHTRVHSPNIFQSMCACMCECGYMCVRTRVLACVYMLCNHVRTCVHMCTLCVCFSVCVCVCVFLRVTKN